MRADETVFRPVPSMRSIDAMGESMAEVTHASMPAIFADPRPVSMVSQNLVSNAIKYRRSRVAPKVQISVQLDTDYWIFAVRDNGIGIAAEDTQEIFNPVQASPWPGNRVRRHRLATCKRIMERYKGASGLDPRQKYGPSSMSLFRPSRP